MGHLPDHQRELDLEPNVWWAAQPKTAQADEISSLVLPKAALTTCLAPRVHSVFSTTILFNMSVSSGWRGGGGARYPGLSNRLSQDYLVP